MNRITPDHLTRSAYVYVRQSTPDQLANNPESRRRQYALADRARVLGWENVIVIDDDLIQFPQNMPDGLEMRVRRSDTRLALAIVGVDSTLQAPCDCALRDSGTEWELVEMVPARQLQGAVETLALVRATLEGIAPHDDKPSTVARINEALRLLRERGQSAALASPSSQAPKETEDGR